MILLNKVSNALLDYAWLVSTIIYGVSTVIVTKDYKDKE